MNTLRSDQIKILVCCHKTCDLPRDDWLLPIHVGASINGTVANMQADNMVNGHECDNISEKNNSYCELTGVYWAWKNLKTIYPHIKYIGINHYRRYFHYRSTPLFKDRVIYSPDEVTNYHIDKSVLSRALIDGATIAPRPQHYRISLASQYRLSHPANGLYEMQQAVHRVSPSFDNAVHKVLYSQNLFMPYNMMVCSWSEFEQYAEWLFSVLAETEDHVTTADYSPYQARIFGFLGERLWNVWLSHREHPLVTFPVADYSGNRDNGVPGIMGNIMRDVAFHISKQGRAEETKYE